MITAIKLLAKGRVTVMFIAAISMFLISSKLGPEKFGLVASITAISGVFSVVLLGPPVTLLLKRPAKISFDHVLSIRNFFICSCAVYITFLLILFILGDERLLTKGASIYLLLATFSGLNSLLVSYFLRIRKIEVSNFHIIIPECVFLVAILLTSELTVAKVMYAWIAQSCCAISLALCRKKVVFDHIFKRKYLTLDYLSALLLGFQNIARDRIIIVLGPALFSLNELGKLAFFLMISRVFIALNGAFANLIITRWVFFKNNPKFLENWIAGIFILSLLYFFCIFGFIKSPYLEEFHITNKESVAVSLSLMASLLYSLQLNKIYADYNIWHFSKYQMVVSISLLMIVFSVSEYLNLFFLHLFVIGSMSFSISAYFRFLGVKN